MPASKASCLWLELFREGTLMKVWNGKPKCLLSEAGRRLQRSALACPNYGQKAPFPPTALDLGEHLGSSHLLWLWGKGRGAGAAGERLIRSSGPAQARPHRLAHFFAAASDCCKGPVPPWSYWQWLMTESPRSPSPGAGCLPLCFDSPCLSGKSAVQQLL